MASCPVCRGRHDGEVPRPADVKREESPPQSRGLTSMELSEIYRWFTEGLDTKDLQEAKTLLEQLA